MDIFAFSGAIVKPFYEIGWIIEILCYSVFKTVL